MTRWVGRTTEETRQSEGASTPIRARGGLLDAAGPEEEIDLCERARITVLHSLGWTP